MVPCATCAYSLLGLSACVGPLAADRRCGFPWLFFSPHTFFRARGASSVILPLAIAYHDLSHRQNGSVLRRLGRGQDFQSRAGSGRQIAAVVATISMGKARVWVVLLARLSVCLSARVAFSRVASLLIDRTISPLPARLVR